MNSKLAQDHVGASASRRERAFTLVELLVVIVCLCMLAMLIVPALARSADNAPSAVCLNNLRQMGVALHMYASENNDYFTWPNWDGGQGDTPGWLYNPVNGIPDPYNAPYNTPLGSDSAWRSGLWYQYVKNPKSYLCPLDIQSLDYVRNERSDMLSSYVMNGAVCGFGGTVARITDCWSPLCYLLWGPDEDSLGIGSPGTYDFNDGANVPGYDPLLGYAYGESIERLHSAYGGNILSVGGSVQFVTTQTWNIQENGNGPGPGGKTLIWWNPFTSSGY